MASVTALPAHSSLTSSMDKHSPTFESQPPLPSPPPQLSPAFVFPERKSMEQERSPPMASVATPSAGGSHGRRASRQGRPALPAFKFNPGEEMAAADSSQPSPKSPKTHPVLEEMAANSRKMRAGKPAALPAFSFHPGMNEMQRTPSPTKSTFNDPLSNTAPHMRASSEILSIEGLSSAQSASPVKSESLHPRGPPVTNPARGHRHKRSGALSVAELDISSLIKLNAMAKHRGGSAPSTPAGVNDPSYENASVSSPASPSLRKPALVTPPASPRRGSLPGPIPRPRVAFSETVAEIPRPLSMISSATEESTSTIRASHSASNSLSSFTSPGRSGSSLSISREDVESARPRTAEASYSTSQKTTDVPSPNTSPKRPLSSSGTPSPSTSQSPPLKKKHFWSSAASDDGDEGDTSGDEQVGDSACKLPSFSPSEISDPTRPRTSPERKASLKKRKVKSSIGGIFTRKTKHRGGRAKARRAPTPPMTVPAADDVFDNDCTVVLEDPTVAPTRPYALESQTLGVRPDTLAGPNRDLASPVIDIDAAMGPFGSEESLPGSSGSSAARRRMHSSRVLADPPSPYHRRAESAPHLPPVSRIGFGFSRMGSNPSMSEEAIDEEEEDDYLAGKVTSESNTDDQDEAVQTSTQISPDCPNTQSPTSNKTADDEVKVEHCDRSDVVGNKTPHPTFVSPISNDFALRRPASAPMEIAVTIAQDSYPPSTGGRSGGASFISSPDADHVSFDGQQARQNRYLGEPSNEHYLRSTDDVPSLTDSVSTATGHVIPRISSSANTCSSADQRSASFSHFAPWSPPRASKRASLVSLTRLIPGSSHGERSKLRFGETAQNEEQEKQQKRKSNRLSRLMTFWRPKDRA